MIDELPNLAALRTAVPYIRAFKGRTFVIKLGGELCRPGASLDAIADQLSVLHQLGMRLVVVHGGGPQADALAERLDVPQRRVAGRRVTDAGTLEIVKMAFAGTANTDLVAALTAAHVPAVGLTGIDGATVQVEKRPPRQVRETPDAEPQTVDYGFVGDVVGVRTELLAGLLEGGWVPVVAPLAADAAGQVYNVNADTLAAELAVALESLKYILLTDVDGVLTDAGDPGTLQSYLDLSRLHALIERGCVSGGMLPKLAACERALRGGVKQVHIVNGTVADTLLVEVFTNEGCGTLIVEKRETGSGEGH